MIDGWDIYWVSRLDSIQAAMVGGACVCGIAALFLILFGSIEQSANFRDADMSGPKKAVKIGIRSGIAGAILGLLVVFVPTTKEAIAIKVIPAVANSADVRGLGSDVVQLARDWLDELRPKSAAGGLVK